MPQKVTATTVNAIRGASTAGRNLVTAADVAAQQAILLVGYATESYVASAISGLGALTSADIDTLAELNAILTDANFATVATSGAYADLSGLPTLGTAAAEDVGAFATAAQGTLADSATQPGDLGTLAVLDTNELTLVESPPIFLSPQDADAAGGINVVDFVIPFAFLLTSVEFRCRESDPPTGSAAQLDVLLAGTTIFSANPTIDAGEFSSTTAATSPVLSSNPTVLTSGQRLQFDLDQIGASDAGRGYYAILRGTRTNA